MPRKRGCMSMSAKINWARERMRQRMRDQRADDRKHKPKPKGKSYRVIGRDGVPCPRCGQPTEVREHVLITEKHRRQAFYFSRWFCCRNSRCPVTLYTDTGIQSHPQRLGAQPKGQGSAKA